jgi:hypothetical protein
MPKLKSTRDFLKWHVFILVQYQLLRPPSFLAWLFAKTSVDGNQGSLPLTCYLGVPPRHIGEPWGKDFLTKFG